MTLLRLNVVKTPQYSNVLHLLASEYIEHSMRNLFYCLYFWFNHTCSVTLGHILGCELKSSLSLSDQIVVLKS